MIVSEAIKNRNEQDFMSDLKLAQRVEEALCIWLDKQNAYKKVTRVNQKGYDILCQTKDNNFKKMEVKRDFWVDKFEHVSDGRKATNNICVEIWSNFNCGNPGWIKYSDSNYIFYIGNENIYILDTVRLRELTDILIDYGIPNKQEPILKKDIYKSIAKMQYTAHHNGNYKVRSVLIKKDWLLKQGCIVKVIGRDISQFNKIASRYKI